MQCFTALPHLYPAVFVGRCGHRLVSPNSVAMAGTVTVRTTNVSSSQPATNNEPAWIIMPTGPIIKPNMLAATMIPAEVMTDPVLATVRRTPTWSCDTPTATSRIKAKAVRASRCGGRTRTGTREPRIPGQRISSHNGAQQVRGATRARNSGLRV